MGFGSFIKSGLKGLRSAAPYIGAGIGAAVGGPAGAKIGYSAGSAAKKATSGIGKQSGSSQMTQPVVHSSINMGASSLGEARSQDRARIKRSYNYPSD